MKPKHLICLLAILLFLFQKSDATTFVVTSNADSGPGTLREAIQLAANNGTTDYDYIYFNLTGSTLSARTIQQTGTFTLSSKVIIDGTSQPGSSFGVTDAKIILERILGSCTGMLLSDVTDVEIVGLWFKNFDYIFNLTGDCHGYSIMMNHVSNITIGKPGKGNAFSNQNTQSIFHKNYFGIDYLNPNAIAQTIKIENNYFGLNDAATALENTNKEGIWIGNGRNVTINSNQGNCYVYVGSAHEYGNGFLVISNNNFANAINSQQYGHGSIAVSKEGLTSQFVTYDLAITGNKATNDQQFCIIIWETRGNLFIDNNQLGDFYDMKNEQDQNFGIGMIRCIASSTAILSNNTIQNRKQGIWLGSCGKTKITKNSIFCTKKGIDIQAPIVNIPVVSLNNITASTVGGVTSPGCNVEIFYTDTCTNYCENGKLYLGSTLSDANGIFSFNFSGTGLITATATLPDGTTSEFNGVKVDTTDALVKNATCGLNNGSITGIQILNASSWHWEDGTGQIVSLDTNLTNVGPGFYRLVLNEINVNCPVITRYFEIVAIPEPVLSGNPFTITQPSCGFNNGAIKFTGVYPTGSTSAWLNASSNPLLYYSDSIGGLSPGTYYFKLFIGEDSTCFNTYGPFTLTNQSGPTLNINGAQITHATCGNSNGSITGITIGNVTGIPFVQWLDSLDNPVGTSIDLTNLPPGKYKLKFKDQSGCDTIITPSYTIQSLGIITIDTALLNITSSQCAYASGTITGVNVQGATSYLWTNAAGQTVSTSLLPGFIYPGTYVLTATNQYGCIKKTDSIHVPTYPYMSFTTPLQIQGRPGRCDSLNGYVNVLNFPNPQNYTFRWIDSLQPTATISTSLNLSGINAGTYILFAKNMAGCEQQVLRAHLSYQPPPVITGTAIITDEICNNQTGGIRGLNVSAGSGVSPFTYTWIDANNNIVSSQQNLLNAPAGYYTLIIKDNIGCSDTSSILQIKNSIVQLNTPKYDDQYIRINTSATLSVLNPQQTTYLLFDSPSATVPIQQNNTGIFITPPLPADKTYYIQKQIGNCTSTKVAVNVYVYDKTNVFVPSAFTPNSDGKNDELRARAYGIVSLDYFRIYNRWGEMIFFTNDISKGWDGKVRGKPQSSSVFVWMVRAKDELTGEFIEKKGTVLLIR